MSWFCVSWRVFRSAQMNFCTQNLEATMLFCKCIGLQLEKIIWPEMSVFDVITTTLWKNCNETERIQRFLIETLSRVIVSRFFLLENLAKTPWQQSTTGERNDYISSNGQIFLKKFPIWWFSSKEINGWGQGVCLLLFRRLGILLVFFVLWFVIFKRRCADCVMSDTCQGYSLIHLFIWITKIQFN